MERVEGTSDFDVNKQIAQANDHKFEVTQETQGQTKLNPSNLNDQNRTNLRTSSSAVKKTEHKERPAIYSMLNALISRQASTKLLMWPSLVKNS